MPLGIGIIGLGMVAATHARALLELTDKVSVRGIYARDAARRDEFGARFGFPAAPSLEALLDDRTVEALLVLTPPNMRQSIVTAAAERSKHLLVEKPIERNSEAATRIVEIAEEAGLRLGVVLQNRFRPGAQALRRLIAEGSLGEVATVEIHIPWWRGQDYYDEPGRGTLERDGGGVLINQAIHMLDLVVWCLGPVHEVQAMAGTSRLHRMEGEDFVSGGLRFASGALGGLIATTASFPGGAGHIAVGFKKGAVRLEGGQLTLTRHDGSTEAVGEASGTGGSADPMAFSHEWHRAVIADFADAVRNERAPAIPGRGALEVHRLIDALMLSAKSGRAVRLDRPA